MDSLVFCVLILTATITAIEAGNPTENGILVNNNSYYSYSIYTDGQATDFLETLDGLEGTFYLGNATLTTANLEFPFPFYGHLVRNLTVVKNGFLFMGRQLHQYLTVSEYIAPLMADLTVNDTQVKFRCVYNKFVTVWEDVRLTNQNSSSFSFQVILYANGTIAFVYEQIGLAVSSIQQSTHPVKIGLSNAYHVLNKNTNTSSIYEYDRLAVSGTNVQTGNVIIFTPRPTCTLQNTCDSCIGVSNFNCQWCSTLSRCSDGVDWYRQQWLDSGCNVSATKNCANQADNSGRPTSNTTQSPHHDDHTDVHDPGSSSGTAPTNPPDVIAVTSHQDNGTSPRPEVTFPTTIAPGDELDFQIERIGSRYVEFSWKPAYDSAFIVRYVVQIKTAATSWYNHTYGYVSTNGNRRKAKIEPLFESTVYNIRMYAYMALGRTGYTTVIAFQTTSSNTGGPTTSGDTSKAGRMVDSLTLTVFCAGFVLYGLKKII